MNNPLLYFIFALFVAGLLMAIVYLSHRLKRSQLEDSGGSIRDREMRLFKLYQNLEDMIGSMESYMEEATAEVLREREELLMLMQRIQIELQEPSHSLLEQPRQNRMLLEAGASQSMRGAPPMGLPMTARMPAPVSPSIPSPVTSSVSSSVSSPPQRRIDDIPQQNMAAPTHTGRHSARKKIEDVRRLSDAGNTEEQIARELTLSRGEVSLILGMIRK